MKLFDKLREICGNVQEALFGRYESCYTQQEYSGHACMGLCGGVSGGTKATGYLSESCIGCPHLSTREKKSIKEVSKEKRGKTACFDFDGVFHSYTSGWKGITNIPDPPVGDVEVIKRELKKLRNAGYDIVLYSTRCETLAGKEAIIEWFIVNDLIHLIDKIVDKKPPAMVYVDDRGITFDGNWDGLADKIIRFKTWME